MSETAAAIQTLNSPLESMEELSEFIQLIKLEIKWTSVAVMYDEKPTSILFLLMTQASVNAVLRCVLPGSQSQEALETMMPDTGTDFMVAACQGTDFTAEDIHSLDLLDSHWQKATKEQLDISAAEQFFSDLHRGFRKKGRGASIMQFSHLD